MKALIFGMLALLAASNSASAQSMNLQVVKIPAVLCASAGCQESDYPVRIQKTKHVINVKAQTRRCPIIQAWYTPHENLADMAAFSSIEVKRIGGPRIELTAAHAAGKSGRLGIMIHVMCQSPRNRDF